MLIPINAILWRKWNQATFDTLDGDSQGQYHITLRTLPELEDFFDGVDKHTPTSNRGFTITIDLQPFLGSAPVSGEQLDVRYMGPDSVRKDWNIPSQRPETAYPLWRLGRGGPTSYDEDLQEYLIIVRDINGDFHARWISDGEFHSVPQPIRSRMLANDVGVHFL